MSTPTFPPSELREFGKPPPLVVGPRRFQGTEGGPPCRQTHEPLHEPRVEPRAGLPTSRRLGQGARAAGNCHQPIPARRTRPLGVVVPAHARGRPVPRQCVQTRPHRPHPTRCPALVRPVGLSAGCGVYPPAPPLRFPLQICPLRARIVAAGASPVVSCGCGPGRTAAPAVGAPRPLPR